MDGSQQLRLITFRVGSELFVLDIMAVRQIVPYGGSVPVPKAPEFVEGIIVLRNEVIPIIDLRARLFPKLGPAERQPLVLIIRSAEGTIGLKVDEVLRILTVGSEAILPPPPLIRGLEGELFIGIIPQDEQLYLLVDIDAILTGEEQRALRAAELEKTANSY